MGGFDNSTKRNTETNNNMERIKKMDTMNHSQPGEHRRRERKSKDRNLREHKIVVFRYYDYIKNEVHRQKTLHDLITMRRTIQELKYKNLYIYCFANNYAMYRWKYHDYSKQEQLLFFENGFSNLPLERWQYICYEHGVKCPLEYVSAKSRGYVLRKAQGLAIIRRNHEPMQCVLHDCAAQLMDNIQHDIEELYQFDFYQNLV